MGSARARRGWWERGGEGGRRRWGEPCACLTEEVQGLIATCPSQGGDCQPLSSSSHKMRNTRPRVVYRPPIDPRRSFCPIDAPAAPLPVARARRRRRSARLSHVGRCTVDARSPPSVRPWRDSTPDPRSPTPPTHFQPHPSRDTPGERARVDSCLLTYNRRLARTLRFGHPRVRRFAYASSAAVLPPLPIRHNNDCLSEHRSPPRLSVLSY